MKFNVTDIEFDYKESKLTFDEEGSWEVMQEYIHDRHSELD